MAEWELKGNEAAAAHIREAARRGALSHALLFTGPGDREAAARYAAAAMECTAESGRPCGRCEACRKVRQDIHPDVVTVRDEAHQNLSVGVVRQARSDAYVRPNEGARKVYLFPDCDLLTEQDQNVLLKIVEEGPPYAAYLFCAENPAAVLPTLRSRCAEVRLRPDGAADRTERKEAEALCRCMAGRKPGAVTELLVRQERSKLQRDALAELLEETRGFFASALLSRAGRPPEPERAEIAALLAKSLTKEQILRTIDLLQNYRRDCRYQISVGQALGALAVEWEGIL